MGEYCFLDRCKQELGLLEASEAKGSREKGGAHGPPKLASPIGMAGLGGPLAWQGPVGYFPCC